MSEKARLPAITDFNDEPANMNAALKSLHLAVLKMQKKHRIRPSGLLAIIAHELHHVARISFEVDAEEAAESK